MSTADIPSVVALQRIAFPPPFPDDYLWQAEHLEAHLERFPEGQFVCEVNSEIVGSCSNARLVTKSDHGDWLETLGSPFLERHDPTGGTLFGVDISVHPDHRRKGIGRRFYQARFDYVWANRLDRYMTGCRLPGLAEAIATEPAMSPEAYAFAVVQGYVFDRTMTPLMRMGLEFVRLEENYMEDPESLNFGALLEWKPW